MTAFQLPAVLAIVAGAAAGALLRYAFGLWFAPTAQGWAVGTLAANWLGAYLIGLIAAGLPLWPDASPQLRLLLITGFLGSLTTFSGFSLEVVGLLQAQRWAAAMALSALHLCGSLCLTVLGLWTVRWLR